MNTLIITFAVFCFVLVILVMVFCYFMFKMVMNPGKSQDMTLEQEFKTIASAKPDDIKEFMEEYTGDSRFSVPKDFEIHRPDDNHLSDAHELETDQSEIAVV